MRSSYIENNYGDVITEYVKVWQPASIVELGILDGYSTAAIAKGVRWLEKNRGFAPQFDSYDLFDEYKFKHGSMECVNAMLDIQGLSQYVSIKKGDAFKVHDNYPQYKERECRGVEMLHIDISNTGKIIRELIDLWHPKIGGRGIVLIEGGTNERDNVEWMTKYEMEPIKREIESNPIINEFYIYGTYLKFPGLTVLLRHWWH